MLLSAFNSYFRIGNLTIHWYAICILIGVIIAVWLGLREAKKLGIGSDVIYLGVLITVPIAIVGARLWYVLFNLKDFNNFGEVLGFKNGEFNGLSGLAIQGGVIFALVTVYIYCKKRQVPLYMIIDLVAPGFLIGQICGRWGNFFNQELYGPIIQNPGFISSLGPFGEQMYINGAYRHPVFLYESLLNLCGFVFMLIARRKIKKLESGDLMAVYLLWYGIVRIPCEILRLNSGVAEPLMMGPIPASIATAVLFIILGVAFFILKRTILTKLAPRRLYQDILEEVRENHIDTLIFDLDGTLLDTRELIDHSFIETFRHFRPDYELSDSELDSFFGPTLEESFSKYSDDPKEVEEMIAYYREYNFAHHDELVMAFKGARDVLRTLSKKKGYRIGVCSSKKCDLVIHGLEWCGLIDYVDVIVGSEDVVKHKPDPEGILLALKELNAVDMDLDDQDKKKRFPRDEEVYLKHALYIGDNKADIDAAKAAGIRSCGVLYIKHPEVMLDANPTFVINKLTELINICGE
jgi:phosphatidylglycerol:prolipoprotein diacylglycerol transferase